ncbi:hypothetical protein IPA_05600 [Ignicoccus pacificus DSM 13166]|uniref:Beta-ribofuranosylaminobenzene 5'-phosphate synthase n=1 Tax=Ignicoccus pacificus DSM 13166 TaxID=940294 RepID=A0A977KBA2_9CREN|nr:hypothetical protein IPA_05600 [Ignicoccus pacificus DSM 13166]
MTIRVSAPSRLHFSLLDLSGDLGYVDGGMGVAIKLPRTVVKAEPWGELLVEGPRADEVRSKLSKLGLKGKVTILQTPPPHMGFGSTTQLLLSSAKALASLNGIDMNSSELAVLMGRGGTSGIGVRIFEEGGFVYDFGHDITIKGSPKPSGASLASPPPSLRLEFPEDWWFLLVYKEERGLYDERREVREFEERTPIPPEESSRTCRIAYMLILGGIVERNYERFVRGINEIQKVGFKKIELEIQPEYVKEVMEEVRKVTGNAGLSSMGHLVYSVIPKKKARKIARQLEIDGFKVMITPPDNEGAKVY